MFWGVNARIKVIKNRKQNSCSILQDHAVKPLGQTAQRQFEKKERYQYKDGGPTIAHENITLG